MNPSVLRLWGTLVLGALLLGCRFSTAGAPLASRDAAGTADHPDRTAPPPDSEPNVAPDRGRTDGSPRDLATPDLQQPPDQTAQPKPISVSKLVAAWSVLKVPCLGNDGKPAGQPIGILDSNTVSFVNGTVTLAGAGQDTTSWVGGKSSVTVVWNPNACGDEYPPSSAAQWESAGLLIRGASLDAQNNLLLAAGTTTDDLDFLNVTGSGAFEAPDFAKPDDSALYSTPQLVPTVIGAKQALIAAGQ